MEKMGHRFQEKDVNFYKPKTDSLVILPVAEHVPSTLCKDYKELLGGLFELINSYFNPDVNSK